MAMLTLDAASETAMKKAVPFRSSFSPYLNELSVAEPGKTSKFLISSSQFEQQVHPVGIKKPDQDTEIDIFSADKYFNEGEDGNDGNDLGSLPRIPSKSSSAKFSPKVAPPPPLPKLDLPRHHSRSATPSVRSESSWNSQNALLHHRNQQERKGSKGTPRRSFLSTLGCNCSCGDKNSVDIDPPAAAEKSPSRSFSIRAAPPKRPAPRPSDLISMSDSQSNASWIRDDIRGGVKLDQVKIGMKNTTEENIFRFPVLDSSAKTTGEKFLEMQRKKEEDDPSRKSMEVFGSPIHRNPKNSLNMLTWDAIIAPKAASIEISENPRGIYNDAASDASSDLFEIESFATNPSQYLTRQASDGGMSSAFTQTCYAPSEASIEWSVVTASAADFSAMSDIEEMRSNNLRGHNNRGISQNDRRSFSDREVPKRRSSGILSGCYSQKAVNVAGDVYRTSSERTSPGRHQHQKPDFSMPMTRFQQDQTEPARFDKRNVQQFAYDSRLLFKH